MKRFIVTLEMRQEVEAEFAVECETEEEAEAHVAKALKDKTLALHELEWEEIYHVEHGDIGIGKIEEEA